MIYPYTLDHITTEHGPAWIAESTMLLGCFGRGDSPDAAIRALEEQENMWAEVTGINAGS